MGQRRSVRTFFTSQFDASQENLCILLTLLARVPGGLRLIIEWFKKFEGCQIEEIASFNQLAANGRPIPVQSTASPANSRGKAQRLVAALTRLTFECRDIDRLRGHRNLAT